MPLPEEQLIGQSDSVVIGQGKEFETAILILLNEQHKELVALREELSALSALSETLGKISESLPDTFKDEA